MVSGSSDYGLPAPKESLQERCRVTLRACSDRTRGSGFKMKESRFRIDVGKKFFSRHRNRLSRRTVDVPSLGVLKAG